MKSIGPMTQWKTDAEHSKRGMSPWSHHGHAPSCINLIPLVQPVISVGRQTRTKVALYLLTITQQVPDPSFPGPRTVQPLRQ